MLLIDREHDAALFRQIWAASNPLCAILSVLSHALIITFRRKMGTFAGLERYGREVDLGGKMLGSTIGISWRGIAYCLTCVAIGGAALAQDLPPTSRRRRR
jgi:hypothetical protein